MVADSEYRHQLEADVMPFKGLLLGLFFIAVGMSTNLRLLIELPFLIVGLTAALMVAKSLVIYPLARAQGLGHGEAVQTGLVLAQGGEFAFVLFTAGVGAALIDRDISRYCRSRGHAVDGGHPGAHRARRAVRPKGPGYSP